MKAILTPVITAINPQTYGWDWTAFRGSPRCLAINHRDLAALDAVIGHVPGRTAVIQAGGNLGLFPKRLAQEFQAVYTFEPSPDCFACLQTNAPEPNILKFQAALGATPKLVQMSTVRRGRKQHLGTHEGLTHIAGAGIVPTLRIDDLGMPVCDLIYLDIEGTELAALEGARSTLARCRPVLALEVHEDYVQWSGVTLDALRAWILRQDYRYVATFLSDEVFAPAERAA